MICMSITPSSRTLAPADLLNASRRCDLIEICADNFIKEPDFQGLLSVTDKPILISCRRERDGGSWKGTEEQRMQLLRNAIIAGPAFVELDLDIADKVPRFGNTKRVISYTSLSSVPQNMDEIFERCWKAKADIVKVTWPTDDLDAAWPLLAATTQKRELPVVGQGVGKSGLTFSLLGRRYGSPWIYAALEKGMEAYESQPTIWQLEEYCWQDLDRKTRFVGVIGLGAAENVTVRILNAAFRELKKPIRCLPILPGKVDRLNKMLGALKINALIVDPMFDGDPAAIGELSGDFATNTGFVDIMTQTKSGWRGKATLFDAMETTIAHAKGERWGEGHPATVFGAGRVAAAAAHFLAHNNAAVSVAAPTDNAAMSIARKVGARHIPWSGVHAAATDILFLGGNAIKSGTGRGELNPSIIREGMTVIDLTMYPGDSPFAEEARSRGATYINPSEVFVSQLQSQFRMLTNMELPTSAIATGLTPV